MKISRKQLATILFILALILALPKGLLFSVAYTGSDGSSFNMTGPSEWAIGIVIILLAIAFLLFITGTKNNDIELSSRKLKIKTRK